MVQNNNIDKKEDDETGNIGFASDQEILELKSLKLKTPEKLIEMAMEHGLENVSDLCKQDIIYHILKRFSEQKRDNIIAGEGVLEVLQDGFGFLRAPEANYRPGPDDIYVSPSQVKDLDLGLVIQLEVKLELQKRREIFCFTKS